MRHHISEGRALYEDNNKGMFSKGLAEWAISNMKVTDPTTGALRKLKPRSLDEVKEALTTAGVALPEAFEYTAWYLFNMAVADYPKTCDDDKRRAMFVEETLSDPDGHPESVLECFEAKMIEDGVVIHWERYL